MTVASVVQYSSNVGVSFLSNAGKDGLQVAPHPRALLEANADPTRRPQGTHNTLTPHPAINLYICSSPTTTLKKHLDVTFTSLKYRHKSL